jgi:hypothetical protein
MGRAMADDRLKKRRDDESETDLQRLICAIMYRLECNAENVVVVKPTWPTLGEVAADLGWDLDRTKSAFLVAEKQGLLGR